MSKVLVYGAGPLGSLFAARLQQGGNDVSILARGQRLADLREHGIVLEDVSTGERTVTRVHEVDVVEALEAQDAYDLVLVIMRKNSALKVLPVLAANQHTPNVLFLGNNAAGPGDYVAALGRERVLTGFPMAAGYFEEGVVHYAVGTEAAIPFGEVDGRITERTQQVAAILASARGFEVEVRTDMDAWLKTHVALLFPALAPALYAAGTDNYRLARTRDLVVLTVRGIREAFRALQAAGLPITPVKYRVLMWIPEPILVFLLQRLLRDERMEVALVRHARMIRDEVRQLTDEFLVLARPTGVPTPTIDALYDYVDPAVPTVPEGRSEVPMRWEGVLITAAVVATVVTAAAFLGRALVRPRKD